MSSYLGKIQLTKCAFNEKRLEESPFIGMSKLDDVSQGNCLDDANDLFSYHSTKRGHL